MIIFEKRRNMKKLVLILSLFISFIGNAQLNQTNEPAINESTNMFFCDSFTVEYAGITGPAVIWDYTNLVGLTGEMRMMTMLDATLTPDAASFPSSTKALEIESFITSYFSSSATERVSQGFQFTEPSFGNVIAKFNTDAETVITYPFAYGNSLIDVFSGEVISAIGTNPLTGKVNATIDGEGTLNLPLGISLPNVIRYHIVDTSFTTVLGLGDLEIIRRQYEYYDLANGNLPVLLFTKIIIQNPGASAPISELSLVLSEYPTSLFAELEENPSINFSVYPNPAIDNISIDGKFSINATGIIIDQSGRIISSFELNNENTIDISSLASGLYQLTIIDNGARTSKTIVKK